MRLAWLHRIKCLPTVHAGVLVTGSFFCLPPLAAEIPWRDKLTTAHAEAKTQGKPLLLHFYTDNCVYCDRLEAGAFQSPDVESAVAKGFVPVKIYANDARDLCKMFKVTKFPMDVVVTPEGETLAHTVSPQEPKQYIAMLAQASSKMPAPAVSQIAAPEANSGSPETPLAGSADLKMGLPDLPSGEMDNLPVDEIVVAPAEVSASNSRAGQSPEMMPGGGIASLASARVNVASPTPNGGQASLDAESAVADVSPKLAMEGYCSVTVFGENKWVEGNPKFGVVHLGKLYLFASAEKMETFLSDPMQYTPVLNEIDVVRFFEEHRIVPGQRRFGTRDPIRQRMFFFADEASMNHFLSEFDRYTDASIEVMNRAVADANPVAQ